MITNVCSSKGQKSAILTLNGESILYTLFTLLFSFLFPFPLFSTYLCICVNISKLEGLIYQCGLYMEDLKEQVENMLKGQPTCEALLSPSDYQPHVPSVRGTTMTCPQVLRLCSTCLNCAANRFLFLLCYEIIYA